MRLSLRRGRRILCSANNGVSVVMYQPVYRRLAEDPRLRIDHTAHLTHTRQIDRQDREDLRAFFARYGIRDRVRHYRRSRITPYDLYLTPSFSDRLVPKFARVKVQMFHGVSFKNCAVSDKTHAFDRLFLPGPYHRRRFLERGLYRDGDPSLVMIGLPKLDRLVDGSIDRDATLLAMGLDPARATVLFAPTGDPGNALQRQGQDILDTLLERLDAPVNVIVKPHDHARPDSAQAIDWRAKLRDWKHERLRSDLGSDVVPLLAAADLLITDASSVAFEYTLLDRPIVFIDVPEILNGPRAESMDLTTWGRKGGTVVERARELARVVPDLLADPTRDGAIRRAIAEDLFYKPGTATSRAVRRLYDELELEPTEALKDVESAHVG